MTGRLLLFSTAPIFLLVAAVAGGLQWPGQNSSAQENTSVEGAPVSCPNGRSFTSSFEISPTQFEVVGVLAAMEGRSAVISGPTGDVPVNLSDTAEVSTGLVIGDPVEAMGTIDEFGVYIAAEITAICLEATPSPAADPSPTPEPGTPTPVETPTPAPTGGTQEDGFCNRGPGQAGDLRLEVDDGEVHVKRGTVLSFMDGSLTVDTIAGPLTVLITSDTEVKGDLSLATEVRLEGEFDFDGNMIAEEVKVLCPDAAHEARFEEEDEDNDGEDDEAGEEADDDDEDDDDEGMDGAPQRMPARATPAVPAIPAIPGEQGTPATPAIPAIPAVPPSRDDDDDGDEDNGNRSHGGSHQDHEDDGHDDKDDDD